MEEQTSAASCLEQLRTRGFAVLHGCIPADAIPALAAELDPATGPAHAACRAAHALPEGAPARGRSQITYCPRFARWLAHAPLLEACVARPACSPRQPVKI